MSDLTKIIENMNRTERTANSVFDRIIRTHKPIPLSRPKEIDQEDLNYITKKLGYEPNAPTPIYRDAAKALLAHHTRNLDMMAWEKAGIKAEKKYLAALRAKATKAARAAKAAKTKKANASQYQDSETQIISLARSARRAQKITEKKARRQAKKGT